MTRGMRGSRFAIFVVGWRISIRPWLVRRCARFGATRFSNFFLDRCQELVRELLRSWGEPTLKVADLHRNFSLATVLVEMICTIVER